MSDLRPTADDSASVEHAGRLLHRQGWSRVFTPNEMTDSWAGLIDQVEEGYRLCVDEYTNDLACRDWLARAWPLFTERVRAARQPELTALDARFRTVTVDDGGAALSHYYRVEREDGWWWLGPYVRSGPLKVRRGRGCPRRTRPAWSPGWTGPGPPTGAQTSKKTLEASATDVLTPLVVSVSTMLV
jgi:hypothetical protein